MTPDFPSHSNGKHPDRSGNQAAVCHDRKEDESPSLAVVNAIAAALVLPKTTYNHSIRLLTLRPLICSSNQHVVSLNDPRSVPSRFVTKAVTF